MCKEEEEEECSRRWRVVLMLAGREVNEGLAYLRIL